jgi:hypothetical protein
MVGDGNTHAYIYIYALYQSDLTGIEWNDGIWYTTRCSKLDRKKKEYSLEKAFRRISSSVREMSKKKERLSKRR